MGIKERKLTDRFLLSLKDNQRRYRINAGMGWVAPPGKMLKATKPTTIKIYPGDVLLRSAMPFHGAVKGFPDTIGWDTVTITADMVGQKIAVFCADEVKATGDLSSEQRDFKSLLESMGGRFRVVRPD